MIVNMKKTYNSKSFLGTSILGKIYKVNINYIKENKIEIKKLEKEITINLPKKYQKSEKNKEIIDDCIKEIYEEIARKELENMMEFMRYIYGFAPEEFKIKRLENKYCMYIRNTLIINPDIIRFNKDIIYSTVIQAFCKIKYREGSNNYKKSIERGIKEYEKLKNTEEIEEKMKKVS